MYKDNIWIPVGMAVQVVIAGSLGALGVIVLSAMQQVTAAAVFVILVFLYLLITRELNKLFVGMAIQALIAGMLANFNIITLNPTQQFLTAGLFLLFIAATLVFRKNN